MKLKICGVYNKGDLQHCINEGVAFVGINFCETSRRHHGRGNILQSLPSMDLQNTQLVAVVTSSSKKDVEDILAHFPFYFIQFSGGQDAEFISQFDCKKIIAVSDKSDARIAVADITLFDVSHGRGVVFNGDVSDVKKPYGIAGGVNSGNILDFKNVYSGAFLLDVASGAEEDGVFSTKNITTLMRLI